jgi:hypothetical protein
MIKRTHKYWTRQKKIAKDKYCSLFFGSNINEEKSYITLTPFFFVTDAKCK